MINKNSPISGELLDFYNAHACYQRPIDRLFSLHEDEKKNRHLCRELNHYLKNLPSPNHYGRLESLKYAAKKFSTDEMAREKALFLISLFAFAALTSPLQWLAIFHLFQIDPTPATFLSSCYLYVRLAKFFLDELNDCDELYEKFYSHRRKSFKGMKSFSLKKEALIYEEIIKKTTSVGIEILKNLEQSSALELLIRQLQDFIDPEISITDRANFFTSPRYIALCEMHGHEQRSNLFKLPEIKGIKRLLKQIDRVIKALPLEVFERIKVDLKKKGDICRLSGEIPLFPVRPFKDAFGNPFKSDQPIFYNYKTAYNAFYESSRSPLETLTCPVTRKKISHDSLMIDLSLVQKRLETIFETLSAPLHS